MRRRKEMDYTFKEFDRNFAKAERAARRGDAYMSEDEEEV